MNVEIASGTRVDMLEWTIDNLTVNENVLVSGTLTAPTIDGITSLNLAGDIDVGDYQIRAKQFYADVATGTAPLVISSTTLISNLNAEYLNGYTSDDFSSSTVVTDHINDLTIHFTEGSIDHGSIQGLADDDHTQYYNALRHTKEVHDLLGIDHGSLSGLSDDDHTQYLLINGTRAMSGSLDMDGNAITGGGSGHDQFSDFVLGEHFLQSEITEISSSIGSGIIVSASGALSVTADNTSNWDDAYSHISSNGTSHGYINQSVTTTATPTFNDLSISNPVNIYSLSHDSFTDYAPNEHIDHTTVSITPNVPLSGGGTIASSRTITLNYLDSDLGVNASDLLYIKDSGIDHDQTTNYVAGEHFLQSAINTISAAVGSGILLSTAGTLSVTTDNTSDWDAAYSHVSSDGTDHTYIDQDVTQTASPTFDDLTITSPSSIYSLSHDSFADFVANEHINHTSVAINTSAPLSGGGDISSNRTISLSYDASTLGINGSNELYVKVGSVDHGSLAGLADDDHTQYLLANGSRTLSSDWDAGSHEIRAETFESDVATGTAPLTVASTTLVTNLNADYLDGNHASAFSLSGHTHDHSTLTNVTSDQHHAGFVGLKDNAGTTVSPDGSDLIQFTDDGIVNVDADEGDLYFSITEASIDHGSIGGLGDDDHTQYLLANGTRTLSADWDAGSHKIRAEQLQSDIVTGTAPIIVASTTLVSNLNADLLDGQEGSYYLDWDNFTDVPSTFTPSAHASEHEVGGSDLVDHDSLTGFVSGEHFLQSAITAISSGVGSGLLTTAAGTLGTTANNTSNWDSAYSKRVDTWGDGLQYAAQTASVDYNASNLTINSGELDTVQDIHTGASPTFEYVTLSNLTPLNNSHATSKSYVDSIAGGLYWLEPVIDEVNFVTSEPGAPSTGDRYINTATGSSSGTATSVTEDYIYEWNGSGWDETVIDFEGPATYVKDEDVQKTFNGSEWVTLGGSAVHNNLTGLQGGTTDEYYHMTQSEHTAATRNATNAVNGLMPSGKLDNWDAAYTHVTASGTSHAYIDQDVTSTASPTFDDLTITSPSSIYNLSHDSFADYVANEHIDWTSDQGATNINAGNITEGSVTQHEGAIDHGSISGLGDDDHTQYLLASGTRDLAGDMSLGGYTLSNGDFELEYIAGATYKTLKDYMNTNNSAGYITGGGFTDNLNGTIAVASGTGMIKTSNNATGVIEFFDWSASSAMSMSVGETNYIYVDYNSGTPILGSETTKSADGRTRFYLGKVFAHAAEAHLLEAGQNITEPIKRVQDRLNGTQGEVVRSSGLVIGETGTLNLTMSQGYAYAGLTRVFLSAVDTSGADTFEYYYRDAPTGWNSTDASAIDPDNYDDGSGTLHALTPNRYGIHWVFVANDGELIVVYGQDDYTLSGAEEAQPPSELPPHATDFAFLAAKVIVQDGASAFTRLESAYDQSFTPAIITDHGDLAGLADDDHTQYLLAAGSRALTGNWDAGSYNIRAQTLQSDVSTGTAPLTVASTTLVTNLNADLWDGNEFATYINQTMLTTDAVTFDDITISNPSNIYSLSHDSFTDFVANEHINHTSVSISGGTGLTGGGDISANRTISLSHLGLEDLSDPGADRILFWDDSETATGWLTASTGITISGTNLTTNDSEIVHDSLSGFVANEHINHTSVSVTAGAGLTGGGDISSTRTINVGEGTGITVAADAISTNDSEIVHDNLSGFVANEHINHTGVTITAGDGLTGGGDISSNRTINVGAGTLIDVVADAVNVDLSELSTSTTDGDGDYFVVVKDDNAQYKLTKANIALSGFNDDLGYTTDHGSLDGLGDDDHTQYLLATGARAISGDITFSTADSIIYAKQDFYINIDKDEEGSHEFGLKEGGGSTVFAVNESGNITTVGSGHDQFTDFVANEHINHTSVSITAGAGLTGGGDISSTRTINVGEGTGISVAADAISTNDSEIVHDNLSGFVANEHINHTTVTLTAGDGLSGGGDISTNRTFTLDLNELGVETTIAAGDFLAMVDITDNGSEKITFANLEGTISHANLADLSTGADHSYIDQDVTSGSSPTFGSTTFTGTVYLWSDADEWIASNGSLVGIGVGGSTRLILTESLLYPFTDEEIGLGDSTHGYSNLYLRNGYNFDSGINPPYVDPAIIIKNTDTNITDYVSGGIRWQNTSSNFSGYEIQVTGFGNTFMIDSTDDNWSTHDPIGQLGPTMWSPSVDSTIALGASGTRFSEFHVDAIVQDEIPDADHTCGAGSITVEGTAGENLVFGDIVYKDSSSKWSKADATNASTLGQIGFCLDTISADSTGTILKQGYVRDDTWDLTFGGGSGNCFVSASEGAFVQTAPAGYIQFIGYAHSANVLCFSPDKAYYTST